jgi:hypothetical protein
MLMSTQGTRFATMAFAAVLTAVTALPAAAQLQLYAKAKSEGAVVLYVGGPTAPWEAMAKKFGDPFSRHPVLDQRRFLQCARQEDRRAACGGQA